MATESQRRHVHTRSIRVDAYVRDDGLWDVEAVLADTKSRDIQLASGVRAAGEPVHEMRLQVTVDEELNVLDASASTSWVPYPGYCGEIEPERLVPAAVARTLAASASWPDEHALFDSWFDEGDDIAALHPSGAGRHPQDPVAPVTHVDWSTIDVLDEVQLPGELAGTAAVASEVARFKEPPRRRETIARLVTHHHVTGRRRPVALVCVRLALDDVVRIEQDNLMPHARTRLPRLLVQLTLEVDDRRRVLAHAQERHD